MRYSHFLYILISVFYTSAHAQYTNLPAFHALSGNYDKDFHTLGSKVHTSIKPYNAFEVKHTFDAWVDSLAYQSDFSQNKWVGRKLFNENFLQFSGEDYDVIINPLFNLQYGTDDNWPNRNPYTNTRGIQIQGRVLKSLHFYTDYHENQLLLPRYLQNRADSIGAIHGRGVFKEFKGGPAKDFGFASGNVSFQPNKIFNFQFGHGKHFIGDGYRSLLLSDNSFNYPYLKITAQFWKIKYWVLYTRLLDINEFYPDQSFLRKYSSFHYLSIDIGERLTGGIFETVIYADDSGDRGYDPNFFNPLIFFRPVESSVGSRSGNVILGATLKYKVNESIHVYGQFVLDEFNTSKISEGDGWWGNKFGWQLGLKGYDLFLPGLMLQTEFNTARPYTYTHVTSNQNYAHYNQALAHPLGANFQEYVLLASYKRNRYFAELKLILAKQGLDEGNQNWGAEIFKPYTTREQEFNNETLQGQQSNLTYFEAKLGYIINPNYNLRFELGFLNRTLDDFIPNDDFASTQYLFFGLNTSLHNYYGDF